MNTEQLTHAMIAYYTGDPQRIQHFLKVHALARLIGLGEGLNAQTQEVLEAAALVHDIGIRIAEQKYQSASGPYQELEGPPVARELLEGLGAAPALIERVCYLVGHHHSYEAIEGQDYQILVEADFLVNFFEEEMSTNAIHSVLHKIFRTTTGTQLCKTMFGLE